MSLPPLAVSGTAAPLGCSVNCFPTPRATNAGRTAAATAPAGARRSPGNGHRTTGTSAAGRPPRGRAGGAARGLTVGGGIADLAQQEDVLGWALGLGLLAALQSLERALGRHDEDEVHDGRGDEDRHDGVDEPADVDEGVRVVA